MVQAVQSTLVFTVVGLPYAAVLGTLAGLAEVVPFVGSTVVMILIALVSLPVGGLLWAKGLASYIVLNQILNFGITPRIMKSQIEIHPLATLLAVGAGAEIAGFYGVLFALPTTAALIAVLKVLRERPQA